MKVAILGLGEAGRLYAEAFHAAGWSVSGFDPAPHEVPAAVDRRASIAEAVAGADLVLGLTTAAHAISAARAAAGHLSREAVYVDLNAGAPELKRDVAAALDGTDVVDGAVIGSVLKFGATVAVLLSGPAAERAAAHLGVIGADAQIVGEEIGAASGRKLLRSVFMKGLGALIAESVDAGERAGEGEWMRQQISDALIDGEQALDRLDRGTRLHAVRRAHEVGDSLALLRDMGGAWPVTTATREKHLQFARAAADIPSELGTALAQVPTSALGDGTDRLGFVDGTVGPIWPSAPIAGRAFTVLVSPGDNRPIHTALTQAGPGDILVVAGGGYTDRALIGELIAEKCQRAGILGLITDGAVRDRSALEDLGFPVWAAGLSPAGPFKHEAGRLREPIAIGGAACAHGDYIVADEDGVLIVPAAEAEFRLQAGLEVLADEERRRQIIRTADAH